MDLCRDQQLMATILLEKNRKDVGRVHFTFCGSPDWWSLFWSNVFSVVSSVISFHDIQTEEKRLLLHLWIHLKHIKFQKKYILFVVYHYNLLKNIHLKKDRLIFLTEPLMTVKLTATHQIFINISKKDITFRLFKKLWLYEYLSKNTVKENLHASRFKPHPKYYH